jgi:hypothetical protein
MHEYPLEQTNAETHTHTQYARKRCNDNSLDGNAN